MELADLVDRGRDVPQVGELDLALLDRADEVLDRIVAVVVHADVDVPHQPLGAADGVPHEGVGHGAEIQLGQELHAGQHGLAVGEGAVRREVHHLVGRDVREHGAALLAAGAVQDRVRVGSELLVVLEELGAAELGRQGLHDHAADQGVLALRGGVVLPAQGAHGQVLVDGSDHSGLVHRAAAGEVGDVRTGELDEVIPEQRVILVQLDHILGRNHLHDGPADLGPGERRALAFPTVPLGRLAAALGRQVLGQRHRHGALGGHDRRVLMDDHQVVQVPRQLVAEVRRVDRLALLGLRLHCLDQRLHVGVFEVRNVGGLDQRRRLGQLAGLVEHAFQLLAEVQDGDEEVALDEALEDGFLAAVLDAVLLDQLAAAGADLLQQLTVVVRTVVVDVDVALRKVVRADDVVSVRLHGLGGLGDQVGDLRVGLVVIQTALLGGEEVVDGAGLDLRQSVH